MVTESPEINFSDTDSLVEQLNRESSEQTPQVVFDGNTSEPETTHTNTPGASAPPPPKPVEEITPLKAKGMAQRWVKFFNNGMKMFLPSIYRKTMLQPGDVEKMRSFVKSHPGKSDKEIHDAISSDDPIYDVSNRFEKYLKAVDGIPLDQDEIDSIAEPLEELIIKYKNLQLSPEWMLVLSVGMVMLPRVAPMMPDLSKLFSGKQ